MKLKILPGPVYDISIFMYRFGYGRLQMPGQTSKTTDDRREIDTKNIYTHTHILIKLTTLFYWHIGYLRDVILRSDVSLKISYMYANNILFHIILITQRMRRESDWVSVWAFGTIVDGAGLFIFDRVGQKDFDGHIVVI